MGVLLFLVLAILPPAHGLTNSTLGYWHIFNNTMLEEYIRDANTSKLATLRELNVNEALRRIDLNQFPQDCSNKKFLISKGMETGFGSEIHTESLGLAMALETGRIYMSPIHRTDKFKCYYKAYTNCTIDDKKYTDQMAYNKVHHPKSRGNIRIFKVDEEARKIAIESKVIDKKAIHSATKDYESEQYLSILESLHFGPYFKIVPTMVEDLVVSLPIAERLKHYWWRTVAVAFLLRQQEHTTRSVKKLSIPGLDSLNGQCVSSYIRHGDKAREMRLINFDTYGEAAERAWELWKKEGKISNDAKKTFVFGTETPSVMKDGIVWASKNGWDLKYNDMQIELFAAKSWDISGKVTFDEKFKNRSKLEDIVSNGKLAKTDPRNEMCYSYHHMYVPKFKVKPSDDVRVPTIVTSKTSNLALRFEYLSMLVNLHDFLKCDITVCTLASNYCRIIDVMRAVQGKPGTLWVDLSVETCAQPPCFYGDEAQLASMSY